MDVLKHTLRGSALALALLGLTLTNAQARDAVAGRAKSQLCMVCHGPVGVSSSPDAPHLAAQPAIYLAVQLRAYRAGTRKHEVMGVIARTLTDDDIDNLAAWYASIQIEAEAPR